ncbi:recombinase family protein [Bradyrhizobium sp. AUGA SZCCT0169]|uniref:recombinase family protein n=1 Tax=Bradyrhizobium sp. AUGA SZCCT0169 TaxID=2807663 RepID=UPI001BAA99EE|nr:recombinase family protein [Bradyrhizobium sp. AUGA SZCCT0169]MBR1248954.1 recombinase family protein [Bradyrhizobium sp. AUGA SZCCT0169]
MKPQAYSYLRISTDLQQKGHGRNRQLEASRAYAEANGLELAEGSELEDIGVSAFKGANVRDGALGRFLEAIRAGLIEPGSYLIVESLDRLSRQQLLTAQSLFLSIIQAGINLVTLTDGRVYRAGTNDLGDLIVSLVIMSRAHEESQTKSLRLSAAWKNKRDSAGSLKPMTRWCPAWLELADDRSGYKKIPDRIAVVQQIFKDSADGIGIYKIAHRLNESNTPTFNQSDGWHQSYIAKILANRAVIGEFQPGMRRNGKRILEGEPVKGYFPVIIDEQLFYRAHQAKTQRQLNGAGRKGAAFSNLFSGLATCAYCGAAMTYDNKGRGPKGGRYLVCTKAKRRLGCRGKRWRYTDFEASFLAFVSEVDIASILDAGDSVDERSQAASEFSALEGELGNVTSLMDKTYALLEAGGPPEFIASKLRELEQRRRGLIQVIAEKRQRLEQLHSLHVRINESKDQIHTLVKRLQSSDASDLFELRAKVSAHLKSVIETLVVAPEGEQPKIAKIVEDTRRLFGEDAKDVVEYIEQRGKRPDQERRYFAVGFRDSRVRIVFPDDNDPLMYQQQITAKGGFIERHDPRQTIDKNAVSE